MATAKPLTKTRWRDDFPALSVPMNGKRLAYLDSAASAQKPRAVIDAMTRIYESGYSNVHRGLYSISQKLTEDYEAARGRVARFIGASENEIVFTRNATEAINLVAASWGGANLKPGDEIVLTQMEHHANIVPWQLIPAGPAVKAIPLTKGGSLDTEALPGLLSERTRIVALTQISNALGTVNNIKKIIQIIRDFNPEIKMLVDGSQGAVHQRVNVKDLGCDFYVFTGHKLYGPTGIGVLYGKYDLLESMPPYQGGGDMIERVSFAGTTFKPPPARFEAGTPPIVEAIGLGAAIDCVESIGMDAIMAHENALTAYAARALAGIEGLTIHGPALDAERAGIISFTMEGAHPSDIATILDKTGVAIRAGHHCCMPLMAALGIDATARASFGLYTDTDDIDQLAEGLRKAQGMFR